MEREIKYGHKRNRGTDMGPSGRFSTKKGIWPEAKFPLSIEMVPKGGLDRLSLG
jgi:hypothetical protein